MHILILGLGINGGGQAAASYFLDHGDQVRITDLKTERELGPAVEALRRRGASFTLGRHDPADVGWADIVVKNPGIPLGSPILAGARRIESDFSMLAKSPFARGLAVICVTGTKGKTTTATALAYCLSRLGRQAWLCGNMGISAFTILERLERGEICDVLVCELSSWQIRDLAHALGGRLPSQELAIITSFHPDHQNAYPSLDAYLADKLALFGPWTRRALVPAFLHERVAERGVPAMVDGESLPCPASLSPYGQAYRALVALGYAETRIAPVLEAFPGVPYRHETVYRSERLLCVDDSAATIPEAVHFTCALFPGKAIHLIAGGSDKGLEPDGMKEDLRNASSIALLDGSFTRGKLMPLLERMHVPYEGPFGSMEDAFAAAWEKAVAPGGPHVLLLSPGAASFGLFRNEFDRGNRFNALVKRYTGAVPAGRTPDTPTA